MSRQNALGNLLRSECHPQSLLSMQNLVSITGCLHVQPQQQLGRAFAHIWQDLLVYFLIQSFQLYPLVSVLYPC
jgi:hypothetical protein